jgi:uncharacterized protein (UPF0333 family)
MKLLSDYINSEGRRIANINMAISFVFGLVLAVYGIWLAYVLKHTFADAAKAKREYDDLYMNFDTKLKSRTTELFSRLDDIISNESNYKEKYDFISKILDSMDCSFYVIDAET